MVTNHRVIFSDNVRATQCAICALKRKIAHYYWYKCLICASILQFHSRVIQKNAHLRSRVAQKMKEVVQFSHLEKILAQSLHIIKKN